MVMLIVEITITANVMICIFFYHRSTEGSTVHGCPIHPSYDNFLYGCPLSMIPGSNFVGNVQISGNVIAEGTYRIMTITFDTDSIADFLDTEDLCTCIDDEMNCDCNFIALYCYFRSDVHNAFVHLKDLFPQSVNVQIIVKAGQYHTTFATKSNHSFNCYCDNFRNHIQLVFDTLDPFDVFQ